MNSLIQKYNIPGPRYTSYPTVPYWDNGTFSKEKWIKTFQQSFAESNASEGISLYIHLPFCESLCTFCACHKHITKRHEVEESYIDTVLKEWELYRNLAKETPVIKEIHLGGGTPTFFASEQLKKLIDGIFSKSKKHQNYEFSFEGHPNNTSKNHLQTLYDLGFTRVSFGVQDYNIKVQKAIHRIQPFKNVQKVHHWAKEIGYHSISHDLVFGLPFQTKENVIHTIHKTKELQPDRISFYSYAHVPWVKGVGQRGFKEADLPKDDQKRELYEIGKELFSEMGYIEIGMDHFALPTDSLYKATQDKTLHRNFMGYTANKTQLMIGLGMSSISDSWYGFAQNAKTIKEYQSIVNNGEIPIFKGHILSKEDVIIRKHILNIMCHFTTSWQPENLQIQDIQVHLNKLQEMISDGLVIVNSNNLTVPEKARPYVRNICMAFDKKLHKKQPKAKLFSMTI
ncbi:coproporphyrinogen III oxidase, SAM and NAD(P)H dependent, oxygen-independent [Tenacibaculum maritimum]|uniref:oxygen-independent coproporphyrinogen III oxidase n=1 Tax=Tenacibaculum maritimum TaxID=107401 RepID=UPI0012E4C812|nr:oxygen-independent coproporphyrinogen III oxidase [Tenacibaculum maritimum]CAA0161081.1 coproporphyrinogen III oxidase, SAM and NAD(P)H dependent, oxygen-independent [Tenacibaculum maritimum]CAA0166343.1 coproporphyrinogen III oxidase, SAM and NAD(P)H dependent, oxygen-independent [Tenacibaculum maritimum]CAA0168170.1 coproporphyrinogen III oxidase, SAM and NAD(P)H dependent, oxygen-independent [Tenacibaculum maritimum]